MSNGQTFTNIDLQWPDKAHVLQLFQGKPVEMVRTPALIIDRSIFTSNCARMHQKALDWGANFRAHVKTHKTAEGTKFQLDSEAGRTHAIVVSTLMEAWGIVKSGLVADGTVKDILYGLPIAKNKLEDMSLLWDEVARHGAVIRVLVDHAEQIEFIEKFESNRPTPRKWSVFIKVDGGQKRAGVSVDSPSFRTVVEKCANSPFITIHGFYCHAGNSYASKSLDEATVFLSEEVSTVNNAAKEALRIIGTTGDLGDTKHWVLSVGSTPTAHAASSETRKKLMEVLHGELELHAGNYSMLDLQQLHTGAIKRSQIAQRVRATVISYYPGRGEEGMDEACIDAGAIAFSKDTGPSGSFGEVIEENGRETEWFLGRISQEHGTLGRKKPGKKLELGQTVDIIGQHACLVAAAYPFYYIVDSDVDNGKRIVDIWIPWKGW